MVRREQPDPLRQNWKTRSRAIRPRNKAGRFAAGVFVTAAFHRSRDDFREVTGEVNP